MDEKESEEIMDDYFAYQFVMGDDSSSNSSGGGSGCLTWCIEATVFFFIIWVLSLIVG